MTPVKPPCTHRHLLVCTNVRPDGSPKPSCGRQGGVELREALKIRVKDAGLKGVVKVTAAGCLDYCPAEGVVVGFYPDGDYLIAEAATEADALWARLIEGLPADPRGAAALPRGPSA